MAFFFHLNLSFTICGMDLSTSINQPLESNELSTISRGYNSPKSLSLADPGHPCLPAVPGLCRS